MPGLVWTDIFTERCPLTGGPVADREASIEFVGLGLPAMDLVLGWSEEAQSYLATIGELVEITGVLGLAPHAVRTFKIDGREVETALCMTEEPLIVPWPVVLARMEQVERPHGPIDPAEIRRLPRLEETWEIAAREGEPIQDDRGTLRPSQMIVVVDPEGVVRAAAVESGALRPSHVVDAVYDATAAMLARDLAEGRPARVLFNDSSTASRLRRLLKKAGIALTIAPTPQADRVVEDLARHAARGGRIETPLLDGVSGADLGALLDAARIFFDAAPWTRLRGDRYIAFRLDGGPWLYANIMGQQGDEHGIALFDSWLGLCRFVSAVPAPGHEAMSALDKTGAAEGMTLYPLGVLHETDAERLTEAGDPVLDGMYPVASRFTANGIAPSAWPSDLYAALMRALPKVIAKRRAATITSIKADVETPQGHLTLRYPADGTEALTGREPAVEVVVEPIGRADDEETWWATPLETDTLRITGPAATRLPQADRAVRSALKWGFIRILELDGHPVWFGNSYADDPAPSLNDLVGAQSLRMYFGTEWHPASARRLPESATEIEATLS